MSVNRTLKYPRKSSIVSFFKIISRFQHRRDFAAEWVLCQEVLGCGLQWGKSLRDNETLIVVVNYEFPPYPGVHICAFYFKKEKRLFSSILSKKTFSFQRAETHIARYNNHLISSLLTLKGLFPQLLSLANGSH